MSAATPNPSAGKPIRVKNHMGWIAGALAVIAFLGLAMYAGRRAPERAAAATENFVAAMRGNLVRTVRVSGTLAAVRYASIAAPSLRGQFRGQMILVKLAAAGSRVKEGDVLAEFDRQQQRLNFEERESEYNSLTEQIKRRQAEIDMDRERQRTELQKAQNDLEAARLENRRNEVISKIDAEKNRQTLIEAEENLKMLQQTQNLRRAAQDAEMKLLEIRRQREELGMEYSRLNYERMVVHSPIDGLVVLQPFWRGNQMAQAQEGDQVRTGMPFMQVVDLSSMVVRSKVNQLDAAYLKPGGKVEIRLDAYPDFQLPGKVESVSPLGIGGGYGGSVRQFMAVFAVEGSDPRLIPDISAAVDVHLGADEGAVLVPRGAVRTGVQDSGIVWVKKDKDQGVERRAVKLGGKNELHWVVLAGLKEGELVLAQAPATDTPASEEKK